MPKINPDAYVMLPWTIRGPSRIGTGYVMHVAELPDFAWTAKSENEALYGFKKALRAYIETIITSGKIPPKPQGDPIAYAVTTDRRSSLGGFLGVQPRILQV